MPRLVQRTRIHVSWICLRTEEGMGCGSVNGICRAECADTLSQICRRTRKTTKIRIILTQSRSRYGTAG